MPEIDDRMELRTSLFGRASVVLAPPMVLLVGVAGLAGEGRPVAIPVRTAQDAVEQRKAVDRLGAVRLLEVFGGNRVEIEARLLRLLDVFFEIADDRALMALAVDTTRERSLGDRPGQSGKNRLQLADEPREQLNPPRLCQANSVTTRMGSR
jgi:hypothetical protein